MASETLESRLEGLDIVQVCLSMVIETLESHLEGYDIVRVHACDKSVLRFRESGSHKIHFASDTSHSGLLRNLLRARLILYCVLQ